MTKTLEALRLRMADEFQAIKGQSQTSVEVSGNGPTLEEAFDQVLGEIEDGHIKFSTPSQDKQPDKAIMILDEVPYETNINHHPLLISQTRGYDVILETGVVMNDNGYTSDKEITPNVLTILRGVARIPTNELLKMPGLCLVREPSAVQK